MISEEVKKEADKIRITKYRGGDFINRDKEMEYWKDTFFGWPFGIKFMYGPKSCGKTTLLEKVRDDILSDKEQKKEITFFWYDLRGQLLASFKDVIDFLFETEESQEIEIKKGIKIGAGSIFEITAQTKKMIEEREINPFKVMDRLIDKEISKGRKVVIVLDELQALKDIYLNSNRTILNELMNYFVKITKVEHKAVVIGMSSNSFFIEQLYNDSVLKGASKFIYLDYLKLPEIYAWLKRYGFSDEDIEYIWDNVGGFNYLLSEIVEAKNKGFDWKEIIETSIQQAKGELTDFFNKIKDKDKRIKTYEFIKENFIIPKTDSIKLRIELRGDVDEIIERLVDNEIIFFDPLKAEIRIQFKTHYFALLDLFQGTETDKL